MSKIQEALRRLQSGQESVPSNSEAMASTGSRATTETTPELSNGRTHTANVPEVDGVKEQLPTFNIAIDLEVLRKEGIYPRNEDVDEVGQQFRQIKRPILNTAFDTGVPEGGNANFIMLASALPRTGKTFCSFNLAVSIARERDVGTVLVDADVLKPNLSRVLDLEDRPGLIDFLLDSSITIDDILVGTDLHGIIVVPAGRQHPDATELLASRRMKKFVSALSARFSERAIIVDTPPLLLTNEAHVLATNMGQIILVIAAGETSQESITQALESLDRSMPINVIFNKTRGRSLREYGSGYGYYGASARGHEHENEEN